MNMQKLTPWFPASINPVRDGVYQVRIRKATKYARWEGGQWHLALRKFERAANARMKSIDCYYTSVFSGWRGLAKQPK